MAVEQDIESILSRLDYIEARLDQAFDRIERYGASEDRQIDDLRYEMEREIGNLRNELSALEHTVRYG